MQDPRLLLEAALTTDPDDPIPDWYPITGRILWGDGGGDITVTTGRQTELADVDPSRLAGSLKNNDGAITPRNSSAPSPFLGNWEQGKRIRLTEFFDDPDSVDTFARTAAAGTSWGTNDTGLTYSTDGDAFISSSDFSVSAGRGRVTLPTVNSWRSVAPTLPTPLADLEVLAAVDMDETPTGGSVDLAEVQVRYGNGLAHFTYGVRVAPGGAVTADIRLEGVGILVSAATGITHTPGTTVWLLGQAFGPELRLRVWLDGTTPPTTWQVRVTNGSNYVPGAVRFRSTALVGNTNAPMEIRWQHQEIRELFPLFTGHLEIPEVRVDSPSVYMPCALSAIDRLGRLGTISAFEGNLDEYITRYGHHSGGLKLHMPLSDPAGPWMAKNLPNVSRLTVSGFFDDIAVPKEPWELITPASTEGPPGDDRSYATWDPAFDAIGSAYLGFAYLKLPLRINVPLGQVIAVSAWWKPRHENTSQPQVAPELLSMQGDQQSVTDGAYCYLRIIGDKISDIFTTQGYVTDEGLDPNSVSLTTPDVQWDVWRLLTLRFDPSTQIAEFMVGNLPVVTGTASMTITGSGLHLRSLTIGSLMCGSIAQVQVRVGAGVMTHQDHLAQYAFGMRGLEGQTVAERIATVAAYAGVPNAYLRIDEGALTPLQKITMAGKKPAELMTEAAQTGQDLLLTNGVGQIVLVPRQRRYNQTASMEVPFGWLVSKSMAYKPDPPITDVTATRTGRGAVVRTNQTAADRYGTRSQSYQLDTLIDADPGNLAEWTVRVYDQMRTRVPALRINMRNRTTAQRKQLLRLQVGDRIELTEMPSGSPDDVPHLIIQGIKHICGLNKRVIEFNTSPVLGATPGEAPYCPIVGTAVVGDDTVIAY